ncbi:MAG: NAD(+) diphosphatase [Pseudorhodoplanes sp.]|nr:NAD(+) diphosphatase [Pseudorhodoplanes sp.]
MSPRFDLGPKPRLAYAGSMLDRAAAKRTDLAMLAELEARPSTAAYVVGGEMIALKKNGSGFDPVFAPGEIGRLGRTTEHVFLGLENDRAHFGIGIDDDSVRALKEREDFLVTDLRSIAVQGLVDPDYLGPIAEAKSLLHWHARHRFCANCGAQTAIVHGGWRRDCPQCGAQHFPRTDPVVIMLAATGDRCLLGRQSRFVAGMWSCLAGFVEPGESIEEAARRETLEEAGIVCGAVRYFASQPWPFPSSLMIGCHAQAISEEITVDRDELEDARWFGRADVAQMLLRRHPDGLTTPPPSAIAHHIIRAWLEGETLLR